MEWNWLPDGTAVIAPGSEDVYLVTQDRRARDVTGVRLTRWHALPNASAVEVAAEAARNVVIFPMGRGPGRPADRPEADALMRMARDYAELFEAGEDLEGYPAWQHKRSAAKFLATSDANDCPHC